MSLQPATPAPAILEDLLAQVAPTAATEADKKATFLNFFRSDCPWCISEMPRLSEIYARRTELNLHIVGIAVGQDTAESTADFARDRDISFPVVADENGALKTAFGIERVPAIVAINAQGLVERTYQGTTEQLPGILEQTLFALAHDAPPPEYNMVGNGCAP